MFEFLKQLFTPSAGPETIQSIVLISLAIAIGVLVGRVKIGGVSLGAAGVLFVGLAIGHLQFTLDTGTQQFVRDFGLILFVYAIGLQVGPSFFSSFRKEGLVLNAIALTGVVTAFVVTWIILKNSTTSPENMAGIMTGAVTNTPSLGAAKSVLNEWSAAHPGVKVGEPANGYAIAYPFGAVGEILLIIIFQRVFRINLKKEQQDFEAKRKLEYPHPESVKARVTNPEVFGKSLYEITHWINAEHIIVTRLKSSGSKEVVTPSANTILQERDVLMAVGLPDDLSRFVHIVGRESSDALITSDDSVETRDVTVTRNAAAQNSIAQLNFEAKMGVKITRIFRGGAEFIANPGFVIHMGDTVRMVGPKIQLREAIAILGNTKSRLAHPELATIFFGIILGIILGSIPFKVPGIPLPVKMGIAAGPLLVAIFISRYGGIARLHSYMNQSAAWFMRDLGIALFFAAVGIQSGKTLYSNFVEYNGLMWVLYGIMITSIPVILMFLIARLVFRVNFLQIAGLVAGTYTSPPTLSFCNTYFKGDVPAQAYATVYPVSTIARILAAQLFILLFMK